MHADRYQIALIASGILVTALFIGFFWREIFPDYRIYQNAYVALEEFRSTYTGQPPPDFNYGVKQIVLNPTENTAPRIDRCTTCHVALQFEHFSPTKIAKDVNGKTILNADGTPLLVPNEDYIWKHLDDAIADLLDPKKNAQLGASQIKERLKQAEAYKALKTAKEGDNTYDMTKVLVMHPLIGRETRPFEYHNIDQYGCTSCHNGNGRALTTDKAHGPVFDSTYEEAFVGEKPQFLEQDSKNDPQFAHLYNHKPADALLFQTTPIYVGALIEAKCAQCHRPTTQTLHHLSNETNTLVKNRNDLSTAIQTSLKNEEEDLITSLTLLNGLKKNGFESTLKELEKSTQDYTLTKDERDAYSAQLTLLQKEGSQNAIKYFQDRLNKLLGSEKLIEPLNQAIAKGQSVDTFVQQQRSSPEATGTLFKKWDAAQYAHDLVAHASLTEFSLKDTTQNISNIEALSSDIDALLKTYQNGSSLFFTQACYACHRISGLSRGGVGPELTSEGESSPWFVKESIYWPQADLKTSTMPNYRLDHEELEALVTFLMGQTGRNKAVSETAYKIAIQQWEAGKKQDWEKPISADKIQDLHYSMMVFATEGCSACHRLQGFESSVGFKIEKDKKPSFDELYAEQEWFQNLFPETITGRQLVDVIDKHAKEIDQHIVEGVRKKGILEDIEEKIPGDIEALYTSFKYASRAKNHDLTPEQIAIWKERLHRILMQFVQEYGLGRLVGPRPNWSGVYRTDTWLMEHFRNPSGSTPNSIMPAFPFDDTKFYALTYMLDHLGRKNRDAVHAIWEHRGFNPEQAFEIHCSQCHGPYRLGNGPVAEWIYPIPKNLRNAEFLQNLTRHKAHESIHFGVKGTPMPPWGEAPKDKLGYDGIPVLSDDQITQIVDWLFSQLPGGTVFEGEKQVPKWEYTPADVIKELRQEKSENKLLPKEKREATPPLLASLKPMLPPPVNVQEIFDVYPNDPGKVEKSLYYIKHKYYTPENLAAGESYFALNCAVCHGKDADGNGTRAGIMVGAKPRMLINLNWLNTRDDLRLLRSIKYGVPGTAMVAWGDQTSILQRLQLVMFIRSLSEQAELRAKLNTAIYENYDQAIQKVDLERKPISKKFEEVQLLYNKAVQERRKADQTVAEGSISSDQATELYKKEIEGLKQVREIENENNLFDQLLSTINQEKELMFALGTNIINNADTKSYLDLFVQALADKETRNKLKAQLIQDLDKKIASIDKQSKVIEGKIITPETQEELSDKHKQKQTLVNLQNRITSDFEQLNKLEKSELKLKVDLKLN